MLTRRDVGLNGSQLTRDIAAFRPVWDPHRKARFCDIEFSTGTTYFPFVRLGLARYQAMSIPGCELSPIVSTAFVQTVPNRTLTCSIGGDGAAALVVSGPAPSSSLGTAGVVLGTNVMEAVVEAQEPTITDPFLGWTAIGGAVPLDGVVNPDGTATWSGSVPAADGLGRRLRVAVREFELHPSDDRSTQPSTTLVATRRLVHVDVVPL